LQGSPAGGRLDGYLTPSKWAMKRYIIIIFKLPNGAVADLPDDVHILFE